MYNQMKGSIEVERWKFQHGKISTLPADDPLNRMLMKRKEMIDRYMEERAAAAQKKQLEEQVEQLLEEKIGKVLKDLTKNFK